MNRSLVIGLVLGLMLFAADRARAQEARVPADTPLPDYAKYHPTTTRGGGPVFIASTNGLPNVLLTGYWPPTNEMLRQFSTNIDQNSNGWVGENWEGRGYNVYSYFPEFPGTLGKGEGDFEVDYQDTSADWWSLLPQIQPIAIVTFSRAGNDSDWEVEGGNRTYAEADWSVDYLEPLRPTPDLPIIISETPLNERFSNQPIDAIIANVNTSGAAVLAFQTVIDDSAFLSNYIGYHGNWYRDLHSDPTQPDWVVTGGHIHVGYAMDLADAVLATEVTVRTVLDHVNFRRAFVAQGDLNGDGTIDRLDFALMAPCLSGPQEFAVPGTCDSVARFELADLDDDGDADLRDYAQFMIQVGIYGEPTLHLPFVDEFPTSQFDLGKWATIFNANIDTVGLAEPSAPYAARLNGDPTGGDILMSHPIDLSGASNVHVRYAWQRTGGGNSPEFGEDLLVYFKEASGNWQLLQRHTGAGADMTTFQFVDFTVPPEGLHEGFRLRFHNFGSVGPLEDWFIDDVSIMAE